MMIYPYNENNIIHQFILQMQEIKDERVRNDLIKVAPHQLATIRIIEKWKDNDSNSDIYDYVDIDCEKTYYSDIARILKAYIGRKSKQSSIYKDYYWAVLMRAGDGQNIILNPPSSIYLADIYTYFIRSMKHGTMQNYTYDLNLSNHFEISEINEKVLSFIKKYNIGQTNEISFDEEDMDIVSIANFINNLKAVPTDDIVGIPKTNKRTKLVEYYSDDHKYENNIDVAMANAEVWAMLYPAITIVNSANHLNNIEQDKLYYLHK